MAGIRNLATGTLHAAGHTKIAPLSMGPSSTVEQHADTTQPDRVLSCLHDRGPYTPVMQRCRGLSRRVHIMTRGFRCRHLVPVVLSLVALAACGTYANTVSPSSDNGTPGGPSSSTQQPRPVACRTAQLRVELHAAASLGVLHGYLSFTNTSHSGCTVTGWPTVIGVPATGMATAGIRERFGTPVARAVQGTPTVDLKPGATAIAAIDATDVPISGNECPPPYKYLKVAPPGEERVTVISARVNAVMGSFPSCSGLHYDVMQPSADLEVTLASG